MVAQSGAPLHFELYTEDDDVNYIRWKWISRKEADRTTSVPEFIINWDDRAQSSTVGGREVPFTINTVREYFLLPEGSLVPRIRTARYYNDLSDWVPERSRTAKTWYANDIFLPVWRPINQLINVVLLCKQKPLEVTGAFLYILKNKVGHADEDEVDDEDIVQSDSDKSVEEVTPPRSARAPPIQVLLSSTSPDRVQDLSSNTPERVQDLTSSSPEGRQVSPDPRDIPSSMGHHPAADREDTGPSDNEPLVGFGSPMVPYPSDDDKEEDVVAVLTSLAASDPSPTSKGKRPLEHRSSFESEDIRIANPDRVKRRVVDPDDEAGGPVSQ
ncbi:hypothetical protein R1sor_018173 [Riccia sorocarpa]|uniref:Uncharacterized protein n=1 Tax=Riccia sorocarpa TaxID=122646 RepID=A0ABD3ICZ7_9MARC